MSHLDSKEDVLRPHMYTSQASADLTIQLEKRFCYETNGEPQTLQFYCISNTPPMTPRQTGLSILPVASWGTRAALHALDGHVGLNSMDANATIL